MKLKIDLTITEADHLYTCLLVAKIHNLRHQSMKNLHVETIADLKDQHRMLEMVLGEIHAAELET